MAQENNEYEIIEITTEFIRLDNFLKFTGIAETGGHAKIIVADGLATVDGELCTQRGRKLYPGMKVELEGLEEVFVIAAQEEETQ